MLEQVKASAGSGKTYALTKVCLDLMRGAAEDAPGRLAGLDRPEAAWTDIMAVTFTIKAAAEMKERLLTSLKQRALGLTEQGPAAGWSQAEASHRLTTIIRRYASLNVRTIDSLRAQLIQAAAPELDLPPDFKTVFDWDEIFLALFDHLNQAALTSDQAAAILERAGRAYARYSRSGFFPIKGFRELLLALFQFRINHPDLPLAKPAQADLDLPPDMAGQSDMLATLMDLVDHLMGLLDEYQKLHALLPIWRWDEALGRVFDQLEPAELFCRLSSVISHLLIDEFQDTSREQWRAIAPLAAECLANGGHVFMVGDVKQAIYGWRGGDSSLFDRVLDAPEISGPAGQVVRRSLEYNRRSAASIVEFNNSFFQGLAEETIALDLAGLMLPDGPEEVVLALKERICAAFDGAVQLVPDRAGQASGLVSLSLALGASTAEVEDKARQWLGELFTQDILPRFPAEDIGLLVRTNEQAALAAKWLMDLNISVITENSLKLSEHPLITDIISCLAFLDYPYDDLAFWALVRSERLFGPFQPPGGPAELTDWLARDRAEPLFSRFQADYPDIWDKAIAPFYQHRGLMNPYDLISEILSRYRVWERNPDAEAFLRRLLEVAHRAGQQGQTSISAFLDFWRDKAADTPVPTRTDAVRVMTIHKAKGLEFPVVVMPFHLFRDPSGPDFLPLDQGDGSCAVVPCDKNLGPAHARALLPELAEQLNLLYVAWTRPVRELHGLVTLPASLEKRSALQRVLRHSLRSYGLINDGDRYVLGRPEEDGRAEDGPDFPAEQGLIEQEYYDQRLEDPHRPMAWLPRLRILRNRFESGSREIRRGILTHLALEKLVFGGQPAQDARRAVVRAMDHLSGQPDEGLLEDITACLTWFLNLPEAGRWLKSGRREQILVDVNGDNYRPDLIIEDEEGLVVIDYKTGRASEDHVRQVGRYLGLLSAMPGENRPDRGVLVYLDEQRLVPVVLRS